MYKELISLESKLYENFNYPINSDSFISFLEHITLKFLKGSEQHETKNIDILEILKTINKKKMEESLIKLILNPYSENNDLLLISEEIKKIKEIEKYILEEFRYYLNFGGFLFSIFYTDEKNILENIKKYIKKIEDYYLKDVENLKDNEIEVMHKILLNLSIVLNKSIGSISKKLKTSEEIINKILEILQKYRILLIINSYHNDDIKKYCFNPQSIRTAILYNSQYNYLNVNGFLLEDYVCRIFNEISNSITSLKIYYESTEGGADFLLVFKNKIIPVEVKFSGESRIALRKAKEQILKSMKLYASDYGIIINRKTDIKIDNNILYLSYLYLPFLERLSI